MKIKINLASKNHVMINNMYKKYCLHVEQLFLSLSHNEEKFNEAGLKNLCKKKEIIFENFCKTFSQKEMKQIKYFGGKKTEPIYSEYWFFRKKLVVKKQIKEAKKERELKREQRSRHISTQVKREVWRRDNGQCVECGSKERLEYDHIIPFSKGGSNTARNIQLLCEDCNKKKSNNIE